MGAVLLDHDYLGSLWDAADFDKLRAGQFCYVAKSGVSRSTACVLCGGSEHGLAHLLACCVATSEDSTTMLQANSGVWRRLLRSALAGDWPTAVMSPHSGVVQLASAVRFAAGVAGQLKRKQPAAR